MEQLKFSPAERKRLHGLAGETYEADARALLEELDAQFDGWREGEMLSSELLSAIHEFRQHGAAAVRPALAAAAEREGAGYERAARAVRARRVFGRLEERPVAPPLGVAALAHAN